MAKKLFRLLTIVALAAGLASLLPTRQAQAATSNTQIKKTAQKLIKQANFNGTILIVKNGKVVYQTARGYSNATFKIKNSTSTAYGIGSLTKSLTAITLLTLVKSGKVSLNDKLSKYYPHIKNADKVTLRQVLNMVSGIQTPASMSTRSFSSAQAYINYLAKHATVNTKQINHWHYSSVNYNLLTGIIMQVTKQSYSTALTQRLFKQAHATGYFSIYHFLVVQAYKKTATTKWWATWRTSTQRIESLGAGEVYVSPMNYYRLISSAISGKIAGAKLTKSLYSHLSPTSHYTAGLYHETSSSGKLYYHAHGRSGSYEATIDISSDGKTAVIAMTNNSSLTKGKTINHTFEDQLFKLLM